MPFNVQHLTHVGADNIEAVLLAAQENPKILPFLASDSEQTNAARNNVEPETNENMKKEAMEHVELRQRQQLKNSGGRRHVEPLCVFDG